MSSVLEKPLTGGLDWRPGWRAMAGKEGKENLKWAALALLGLSIALAYQIHRVIPIYGGGLLDSVWSSVTTTLTIGAPLAGLLLGLLQTVPEQRRDLWAFLIHRPAARATLFWGKVVAGLCLYLGATLLPLLGVALWARAPGHLAAPFVWGLTLGGAGAVLAGMPFYFAGMLAGLRPARWWGSRAAPVAAALPAAALTLAVPEFWQAALTALFAAAVLCVAARASLLTTGVYEGQPRSGRAALGVGLYVGICTVLVGLVVFGVNAWQTLLPAPRRNDPPYASYDFTRAGRIVRTTYSPDTQTYTDVRDLSGVPVPPPKRLGSTFSRNDFLQAVALVWPREQVRATSYTSPGRYVLSFFHYSQSGVSDEEWYYDLADRRFVSYSLLTYRRVGEIGPGGFAPSAADPAVVGRFPAPLGPIGLAQDMYPPALLSFNRALYLVDPFSRTVRFITLGPAPERVRRAAFLSPDDPWGGSPFGAHVGKYGFAVVTDSRFWVLSSAGDVLFSMARDYDRSAYTSVSAAMTPDGGRFLFWYIAKDWAKPDRVVTYDAQGRTLRCDVLPPLRQPAHDAAVPPVYLFGLGVPLVVDSGFYGFAAAGHRLGWPAVDDIWRGMQDAAPTSWHILELICAMSAVSGLLAAALAWGIGRRCAYTKTGQWAWAVGAFWLGLPGVLLLVSLRDWPAREACPNCGRPRVVTRELCEHCGASFAPPTPDGTEIFEGENDALEEFQVALPGA